MAAAHSMIRVELTPEEIRRIVDALSSHAARAELMAAFTSTTKAERLLLDAIEARAIASRLAQLEAKP